MIGLPRNMDGSEGPRAQASRAYARNLAEALDLPVLLWDERWSSASAEAAMIRQDMSRAKR
ncbi:MAG TPA: Holliday junction resolvase RuvX, partial [Erythrobacter sp.]|nr:Holliday junction resolvase RuvX [Erythrobacter sp.]